MPEQLNITDSIGQPIGITFLNGQGTSGVLCDAKDNTLFVIEYLYQTQFAMKQYPYSSIQNVYSFPNCPESGSRRVY